MHTRVRDFSNSHPLSEEIGGGRRRRTATGYDRRKVSYVTYGKKRNERPDVGGVSIRSRNDAPSRKGCVVHGLSLIHI